MASTTEETRKVAEAFYAAATGGGAEAMDALISPDGTWWILGHGYRDRSKFLSTLQKAAEGMNADGPIKVISSRNELIGLVADGDRATVEFERDIEWEGGGYHQNYVLSLQVSDGMVTALREYASGAAAKAAGMYRTGLLKDDD
ncbi:MAG TPA: nuclear transport factor 2 family protein [Acidimicrobiales bacterium]|jgi:ketosteroid isomerase-like protein